MRTKALTSIGMVRAHKIHLEGLRRIRNQLWAEAQEHYLAGTSWWINDPNVLGAATEEQAGRYIGDPWDNIIQTLTENEVSISEVLTRVGDETGRQTQGDINRVARCLKARGWIRVQIGTGRDRHWIYRKGRDGGG